MELLQRWIQMTQHGLQGSAAHTAVPGQVEDLQQRRAAEHLTCAETVWIEPSSSPGNTFLQRYGPTQGGDVISAQATAAQPQRSQPNNMVEVGGQRLQTATNQLIPGDVQLLQLGEELQKGG